jgi:hypothetical protein
LYALFVPGWTQLARSIYYGGQVQRVYLGFLWKALPADNAEAKTILDHFVSAVANDAGNQISSLEYSLLFFGVWLLIYLIWWISVNAPLAAK